MRGQTSRKQNRPDSEVVRNVSSRTPVRAPASTSSFEDFWPVYLQAHRSPVTRVFHYTGSLGAMAAMLTGIMFDLRILALAPVIGYGLAWTGHFGFEKNRPAAFQQPFYSFLGDWKMLWFFLTGRIRKEFQSHQIDADGR